ncbi:MAG TPA: hypothetical protein VFD60_00150 [Nitrososphaeraceae archaeon]|jgi:hypothetical protein|nr:hypothetical protein [Nitrososphaeraceae archaeon]
MFNGKTGKSGKIVLYERIREYGESDYVIATVIDSASGIENATVDGNIELSGFLYRIRILSVYVHAVSPDGSIETSISWTNPKRRPSGFH